MGLITTRAPFEDVEQDIKRRLIEWIRKELDKPAPPPPPPPPPPEPAPLTLEQLQELDEALRKDVIDVYKLQVLPQEEKTSFITLGENIIRDESLRYLKRHDRRQTRD